jgi:hypothetical protein
VAAYDAAGNSASSATTFATVPGLSVTSDPGSASGSGSDGNLGGPVVAPDVTAPVLAVTSPARAARVRGSVRVRAVATDESGVARMQLALDRKPLKTVGGGRLSATVSLRRVRAGRHTVTVRAVDGSGNAATRALRVTVLAPRRR